MTFFLQCRQPRDGQIFIRIECPYALFPELQMSNQQLQVKTWNTSIYCNRFSVLLLFTVIIFPDAHGVCALMSCNSDKLFFPHFTFADMFLPAFSFTLAFFKPDSFSASVTGNERGLQREAASTLSMKRLPHIHNTLHQLKASSIFVVSSVLVQFLLNNL